ncbi:hypothetical protein RvY_18392 [Ramazzottius varieornatus]|uniref:LRRCT domain-containing protein n=1 Tax=Ramazzottius varieornatus TaxID=947166 RepID=A0A1D1W5M8_RAMVA|nr:hypothetical protein RvY_18392 [Ramazzottius varieornatus]
MAGMSWMLFIVASYILVERGVTEAACPTSCQCDVAQDGQKRIRCQLVDRSPPLDLTRFDRNVQVLEIVISGPSRSKPYGPDVPPEFGDLPRLDKLVLKNAGIERLSASTASGLSRLFTLDLTGNNIRSLTDLSLADLPQLGVLNLGQNQITSIDGQSLRFLPKLQSLTLADNKISQVSVDAFTSQALLRVLDLRNNNLRQLPNDLFDRITRVERLDLRGNQLIVLPRGLLRLNALRFLLLDNNRLSAIPREFVLAWRSDTALEDVTLYGNPLQCDEGLQPLVDWVKTSAGVQQVCRVVGRTGDKEKSGTCPVCEAPSRLRGVPLDQLRASDLAVTADGSSSPLSSRLVRGDDGSRPSQASSFIITEVRSRSSRPTQFP